MSAEASGGHYISGPDLDRALEPFRKIRVAVGDKMDIMVEFHSMWNLPTAIRIARALEPFDTFWHEDPIKMDALADLSAYAAASRAPVCASETLAFRQSFRELLEARATGIVMLDLSWCGGLSEAKKIATMAEAWHLPVAPHDWARRLMASVHLSRRQLLIQETVRAFFTAGTRNGDQPAAHRELLYPPGRWTGHRLPARIPPDATSDPILSSTSKPSWTRTPPSARPALEPTVLGRHHGPQDRVTRRRSALLGRRRPAVGARRCASRAACARLARWLRGRRRRPGQSALRRGSKKTFTNRMNDGAAGRFWAGTMAFQPELVHGQGAFYRLDPDYRVTRVVEEVTLSNGLDWSLDNRLMYYVDSTSQQIDTFPFDLETGALGPRSTAITIPSNE
jgi:hypothetical protein